MLCLGFEQHSLEKSVLESLRTIQLSVKMGSDVTGQANATQQKHIPY